MKQFARRFLRFSVLLLTACSTTYQKDHYEASQYIIQTTDTLSSNTELSKELLPYRDSMSRVMNEQVAYAYSPLVKGLPESPLGNFVADACHTIIAQYCQKISLPGPDFTMLNSGGLRTALPAGKITRGNIYELMPFENELVIIELDDTTFQKLMNYIVHKKGNPVSHLRMKITDSTATEVFVNGLPQSSQPFFRLLTSDYLARGGDNLEFLKNLPVIPTGIKVRDAILTYLQQNGGDTLQAKTDGRIYR